MARWDPTEFQAAVNNFLSRRGWSQPELARVAGISQAVVNRWLSTDPQMVVQPTDPSLRKLAPVIGIPHLELMRMAGRLDATVTAPSKPADLEAFLRDMESGWLASEEHERPLRTEVARAAFPHHQRRPSNRRIRGNDAGLDNSNAEYLKHK